MAARAAMLAAKRANENSLAKDGPVGKKRRKLKRRESYVDFLESHNPKALEHVLHEIDKPEKKKTVKYNATNMWDGVTDYFGAGAAAFDQLGAANGYRLIYCESHGVNAFLVREDLVTVLQQHETSQPLRMQKIYRPPNYFGYMYSLKFALY